MAELTRLFEIPYHQQKKYPKSDMLCRKDPDGSWKKYSTEEVIAIVNRLSIGLLNYGIKAGDKVGLISENRPEWNFIDLAILQIGAVDVPIYPTITEADYEFIFNNSEIKACFVSSQDLLGKVSNIKHKVPTLQDIFTIDKIKDAKNWEEVLNFEGSATQADVDAAKDAVKTNDLATIIYTSGTTGVPKGVMLSHGNIISNVQAVLTILPLESTDRNLSFLPLCHIFERTVLYSYMIAGCSTYYAESMDTIGDNLKEVKPQYFSTVPRLLEKVYDKIVAKGNTLEGSKRKLFFWAMDLGDQWEPTGKSLSYKLKLSLARKLIFSKWQEALGGEIKGIITGAAALQKRLETVFNAAGMPVRQGYGMTESSPVITISRFEDDDYMVGTVGRPIPGVEVKIEPGSGEICCKGPNVMMGYYKRPDATAETIDADGWLHTGDVGEFVDGKYLKITDRIKQLFKTSGGKYVAPTPIESKFVESPMIEAMLVTGNDQKFVGALFVPSEEQLKHFCTECNIANSSMKEMIQHKEVQDCFQKICDEYNVNFGHVEQIKRFKLLSEPWSIETGELTPTMKVKRKVVMEKYAKEIDEIYNV